MSEVEEQAKPPKLIVNVADLRRRLGQRLTEPIEVQLETLSVVGSRTKPEPVRGEVTVESIERGVSTYGAVVFHWEGDCRRCLELIVGQLEVDIMELFQIDATEGSDLIPFDGDQIDLVPVDRDAVMLSLPLAPLCRQECAGPDPDRYPALTADEIEEQKAAEAAATPDPRWAALDQLDLGEN